MSDDDGDAPGWAGGAEQEAAKAELERLKKLGEGLRRLTSAAKAVRDPAELAAIQDRNLDAFERMTGDMGLAALDRMRAAIALLSSPAEAAAAAAKGVAIGEAAVAAAREEIEAARDLETEKLLSLLRRHLEQAQQQVAAESGFEPFEPFDAAPTDPEAAADQDEADGQKD